MYVLFPGRHLVNTTFQEIYLRSLMGSRISDVETVGPRPRGNAVLEGIVYAITSADLDTVRYSPVPLTTRMNAVSGFSQAIRQSTGATGFIVPIPHFRSNRRFADFTVKEVREQTDGYLQLTPENTAVLCSTPELMQLYGEQGFTILPAERSKAFKHVKPVYPREVLEAIMNAKQTWHADPDIRAMVHPSTIDAWKSAPWMVDRMRRIWSDPLLNDTGDLTEERDYSTYAIGMSNPAIMDIKYHELKPAIKEGRIVDEGCADGALLERIARDFPDSDLIGVDITPKFIQRCRVKQSEGAFGGSYVHFHQRNIMQPIFQDGSIDTVLCNSTLHELWSYDRQMRSIDTYLKLKFRQLRPGGILAIRDVVGPEQGDEEVYLWCNPDNGSNANPLKQFSSKKALKSHLDGLSTHARFLRFAQDYLREMRESGRRGQSTKVKYRICEDTFVLPRRTATEFLTKMSYTDNWSSEMNEEFAFFTLKDWMKKLQQHGFKVLHATPDQQPLTRQYTSEWTRKQVWEGNAVLFKDGLHALPPHEFPVTNMVLVGQKPA